MSRIPKNNHYHYAEKFTDRAKKARRRGLVLPKRFLFLAVLLVLTFTVITVTFSTTELSDGAASGGSIMISVRSARIGRDAAIGVNTVDSLAQTGADSDLADTGVNVDLASTGSQTYFYSGEGNGTNWSKTAMTVSADGFYEYYQITSTTTHQFKIGTSSDQYAYNYTYVDSGFNSTDVTQIGHYGSNNCYCWKGSAHYIIVYYPNTIINTTSSPKICASTTLPDNSLQIDLGEFFTNSSSHTDHSMTNNSGTWTFTMTLAANTTREFYFHRYYKNISGTDKYYKDQNQATMTYNHCTDWQFEENNKGNPKLQTVIAGAYTFSINQSSLKVSVTYPSYTVTTSMTDNDGDDTVDPANAPTPATSTVAIGSSVTVTAQTANTGYEFLGWDVTAGTVKTGSYSGTALTQRTSANTLTVFPYGTSSSVNLQAVYRIAAFTITYHSDAATPTAASGTIMNPSTDSVPATQTKQYNVPCTLTNHVFTRPGYTQVGWATSVNYTLQTSSGNTTYYALGGNYTGNADLTLYPVWELNSPVNTKPNYYSAQDPEDQHPEQPKIVSTGSMVVGGDPVSLSIDLEGGNSSFYSNNSNITRSYSYHITGPTDGNNVVQASVGTNPSDPNTFMKFTASIPGSYEVYVTVTDTSATNVINSNNTASASSNTATITVAPDVPIFTIKAYNVVDDDRNGATAETAYKILLGNRYYFSAQVDSTYLFSHPVSNYTYTWSTNADFAEAHIVGTGSSITFTNTVVPNTSPREYSVTEITYDPSNPPATDPRTLADESHGLEQVVLYCRATCNEVSNDTLARHLFYFIQPLIESFKYEPMQKIYVTNDQTVSLAAQYNIDNDPSYTTRLFFSHDNTTPFTKALESRGFIDSFFTAIKAYLYPTGPKYFYLEMEGYNSQHELITSVSEKIHTTVGTFDSTASRALYFDNNTNVDLKNYLVMCYYIDGSGNLCYQTAQDLKKGDENYEGLHYRVMIPENASAVRFGFLANDIDRVRYYGSPYIDEYDTIVGFSVPVYYGYTDQIALTNSPRKITATSSADVGSLKSFTCTAGSY